MDVQGRMDITYLFRRRPGAFSIERVFAPVIEQLRQQGLDIRTAQVPGESGPFRNVLRNLAWSRRIQAELLHVTGDVNYCILGHQAQVAVLTLHDFGFLTHLHGLKRWLVKKLWVDWPVRRSDAITCVSEQTRAELLGLTAVDPAKVVVIPNPVHPQFARRDKDFLTACPRILHFNVTPNKNLLRTAAALQGITCHLRVIGAVTTEQRQELERRCVDFSCVQNLDDRQLVGEYDQCDLLCFPSTSEGFGLPVLEAQAVGRPVLASRVAPLPEVGGAEGACYVDPLDTASIRAGLLRILSDHDYRVRLVAAGHANARRFQVAGIARQYADLYARLLAGRRP